MAQDHELFDGWLQDFVARARIECDQLFEYKCPMSWGNLAQTSDPSVRHCAECQKPVYLVTSEELLLERAERGECAAIVLLDELPERDDQYEDRRPMMLGRVAPPRAGWPPRDD